MRRGSSAFTSNWGSSTCRGGIRSSSLSSSTFSFAGTSSTSSTAAASGSRCFISSTSSTSISSSSLSTLLKAQRSSSISKPGSGGRSSIFAQAEQGGSAGGARSGGIFGPRLNASTSTSLLAPLSAAATRAADLATASSSSKESGEESDEPSSRSRPSATASPPPPLPSSNLAASTKPEDGDGAAKPQQLGKVRTFLKKYGAVGVVTYFGLYGATLASFYGAYSSGILYAGDVVGLIEYFNLGDLFDESLLTPKVGNFALAWVSTKFTEPIRFAITIGVTPSISRWWTGHHQHKLEVKREREQQKQQQQQQQLHQEGEEEKEKKKDEEEGTTKH